MNRFRTRALLRGGLTGFAAVLAGLLGPAAAGAVVIDTATLGSATGATVPFAAAGAPAYAGVALVPDGVQRANLLAAKIATVATSAPCTDPALTADFVLGAVLGSQPVCSHGGGVVHASEVFALSWDPNGHNEYTAPYVEQFLRDVATASGTGADPYAVTSQYTDAAGRAANSSLFGGGVRDGTAYPTSGCPVSGTYLFASAAPGGAAPGPNDVCLTSAQIRSELASAVAANGLLTQIHAGDTPLLVVLTPPRVVDCLDTAGLLCSANSSATVAKAQFCSYHGQVTVAGMTLPYVVQPFTANTGCDEPDVEKIPNPVDNTQLAKLEGERLVSPLSQATIDALVNPSLTGWFAADGSESSDNGCVPLKGLDAVTLSGTTYQLQHAFNNGGTLVDTPIALPCAGGVSTQAAFVLPSPVDPGDVVSLDGSKGNNTLVVPASGYAWTFGDGATATGPSVTHAFAAAGTYPVKLTVTDRGGNTASTTQTLTVGHALPVPAPAPPPVTPPRQSGGAAGAGGEPAAGAPKLAATLQWLPQSLPGMLRGGTAIDVATNTAADGLATVVIPRAAAVRAHLPVHGRDRYVVIGRGTVSIARAGRTRVHFRVSRAVAAKLRRLRHLTVTVKMILTGPRGDHLPLVTAGTY